MKFIVVLFIEAILACRIICTGANGVNSHEMALRAISHSKVKHQVVALCGRSSRLFEKIKHLSKLYNFPVKPFSHLKAEDICILLNQSSLKFFVSVFVYFFTFSFLHYVFFLMQHLIESPTFYF